MADKRIAAAFHEVHAKTPAAVKLTARKFGKARAEKQRVAIALSKARVAGARIPLKGGSETLAAGSMKYQALTGRKENLAAKAEFKRGPVTGDEE